MTRVLFLGDMAATGFGTVTTDLGRGLLALGLDVRFMTQNENDGVPDDLRERTAILGAKHGWLGTELPSEAALDSPEIREYQSEVRTERLKGIFTGGLFEDGWVPEQAILLGDVGSLKLGPVPDLIPDGFPVWHYVPVEGVGMPPAWAEVWKKLRPVAMCQFGADEIEKLTHRPVPVIYHGVDTRDFQPVTPTTPLRMIGPKNPVVLRSREEIRTFLGWPQDDFIMFRADRNMPRKQYPALMRIAADFIKAHPNARLIWHCRTLDQGGDLKDERSKYPEAIANRLNSTGLNDAFGVAPRSVLRAMYAAADVYVSTSAEGFGLTIAEAMACGTPAIGLAFSSVPEVLGPGGWTVPIGYLVENIYSHFWAAPDHRKYVAALEEAYASRSERSIRGKKGMFHVLTHFSWRRAAEQFAALIEGEGVAAPLPVEKPARALPPGLILPAGVRL
jgi:glycosyltransferase involved in cell wall biosynthesis